MNTNAMWVIQAGKHNSVQHVLQPCYIILNQNDVPVPLGRASANDDEDEDANEEAAAGSDTPAPCLNSSELCWLNEY